MSDGWDKIKTNLFDDAVFDSELVANTKIAALREVVHKLFQNTNLGHDTAQTILNRLIAAEKATSFVVHRHFAIPHILVLPDMMSGVRSGWFRSASGIAFRSGAVERVHIILCVIGSDRSLSSTVARGTEFLMNDTQRERLIGAQSPLEFKRCVEAILTLSSITSDNSPIVAASQKYTREIELINRLGLHARAAAKLVQLVVKFNSEIVIATSRHPEAVNARSIMNVMMLAAARGTTLLLTATGDDAEAALDAIARLVADRFGESD